MQLNTHRQSGITLVEVMVTIAITSIGLLGLNSLQLQANRSTQDSGNRSQAIWMLEDMANRIRANTLGAQNYHTSGNPVSCNSAPAKICSAYHNGTSRVAAADNCTATEMAASDLWEVACGFGGTVSGSSITRGNATDFIANPELTIAVDASNRTTMTLSWDTRTSGMDSDGNTIYASNSDQIEVRRASLTSVIQP